MIAVSAFIHILLTMFVGAFQYTTIYLLIHFMDWLDGHDLATGIRDFSLSYGITPVTDTINAISTVIPYTNGNVEKLLAMVLYLGVLLGASLFFWKNDKSGMVIIPLIAGGAFLTACVLIAYF